MRPFYITLDNNVDIAQAWGCWLYVQIGEFALFAGRKMPCGVRLVWKHLLPRLRFCRFFQSSAREM